jgi:hypothetical protein
VLSEVKQQYYIKVQCRKTLKYKDSQYYESYMTLPADLCRFWKLENGQIVRLALDGCERAVLSKAQSKPHIHLITYHDWLSVIVPILQKNNRLTYGEIRKHTGLVLKSAPAIWVKQAENDIGLVRARDHKTHEIVWSLHSSKLKMQESVAQKTPPHLRNATLTEILVNK